MLADGWGDKNYVDHYHRVFGTLEEEFQAASRKLNLCATDRLVDIGCGDGLFLSCCLDRIEQAVGVDASPHQLDLARQRLGGHPQAMLIQSSFLEFDAGDRRFTKGFSRKALHHLTDPEKQRFFAYLGRAFEKNGLFLLEDGIFFDFEREELELHWEALMREAETYYGTLWSAKRSDVQECFRNEYPSGIRAWTKALAAGGFTVIETERRSSFYGSILAVKR